MIEPSDNRAHQDREASASFLPRSLSSCRSTNSDASHLVGDWDRFRVLALASCPAILLPLYVAGSSLELSVVATPDRYGGCSVLGSALAPFVYLLFCRLSAFELKSEDQPQMSARVLVRVSHPKPLT